MINILLKKKETSVTVMSGSHREEPMAKDKVAAVAGGPAGGLIG